MTTKNAKRSLTVLLSLIVVVISALIAAACLKFPFRSTRPPVIDTAALNPEVADMINAALVRTAKNSAASWGRLGSVLMHYEFTDEASRAFDEASRLAPAEPRWPYLHASMLLPRDPQRALPLLRRAATLCPRQPDAPRLRLAQFLAERGAGSEAESIFNGLLRENPSHTPALLGLARLRQAEGRLADATNLLARCLTDAHTTKAAHTLLTAVQQSAGTSDLAAANARKTAALPADQPWPDPFWSETLAFRVGRKARLEDASALIDQGRMTQALEILAALTREHPLEEEAWYQTGWAHNQQGNHAEAERALRECLRLSPRSPKGHAQLGVALLGQRRYPEAIEILQAALLLKPTWRELHSNLGYAFVQTGRQEEAVSRFRQALVLDPNYLPSYTALADLLIRQGGKEEARRLLLQALDLNPADSRAKSLWERLEVAP